MPRRVLLVDAVGRTIDVLLDVSVQHLELFLRQVIGELEPVVELENLQLTDLLPNPSGPWRRS